MTYRRLCFWLVVLCCATGARGNSDELLTRLQPQGYVSDFANVLPAAQRSELQNFLADLERKTSVEVAVVTVSSLEGGEVDDFTNRLFGKWGIGKKGKDNGVMILAAIQDRKGRIEVGYGLEGVLPDALAGRILREQMFPAFKQGRYGDGLIEAAHAVAKRVGTGSSESTGLPREMWGPVIIAVIIIWLFFMVRAFGWRAVFRGLTSPHRWNDGGYSSGGFSSGGGGGFSGFGGGSSGGGGASGGW